MHGTIGFGVGRRGFRAVAAVLLLAGLTGGSGLGAQATGTSKADGPSAGSAGAKEFGMAADEALQAMRSRAGELKITGVAVVAYLEGDPVSGWESRMAVVGRRKDEPTATSKGNNLIGIAYAKAAEMADTLKDSGSALRPPMTGEFGWTGGVIAKGKKGYLIAAFSGGQSEDDVKVSQAGVASLQGHL